MCSTAFLSLLYDILYYTWSVLLSISDPVTDIIVAILYFKNDDIAFGISTVVVVVIPGALVSLLSFQWLIYDYTLATKAPYLLNPPDLTRHFHKEKRKEEKEPPLVERKVTELGAEIVTNITTNTDETVGEEHILVTEKGNCNGIYNSDWDFPFHPVETFDEVEVDSGDSLNAVPRRVDFITQISRDAGISKWPVPLERLNITPALQSKNVYYRTLADLRLPSLQPSWTCDLGNLGVVLWHVAGLPGVPRYTKLLFQRIKHYKNLSRLDSSYNKFVSDAKAKGVKEVCFNSQLMQLSHGRRDAALLRLVEGALESTPQLLLQLYIIIMYTKDQTNWFTYASVLCSFMSVTWSMTSYTYEHRAARYDKGSMSMLGYFCTAAIKFCMTISRVAAFLLAATYFSGYVVLGVCLAHWLTCLIYVCMTKTFFYGGLLWSENFFKLSVSLVLLLSFINIKEGDSRIRWVLYHLFVFIQNFGMLTFWYTMRTYYDPSLNSEPDRDTLIAAVSVVVGGMALGTVLTAVYYRFLHPSNNTLGVKATNDVLESLLQKHTTKTLQLETAI